MNDQLKRSDYFYHLPEELIAQDPLGDRSSSRMLVLGRTDGSIEHRHFYDLCEYLREGDCLVFNDTRVIPARLLGIKEDTGAAAEILLLKRMDVPAGAEKVDSDSAGSFCASAKGAADGSIKGTIYDQAKENKNEFHTCRWECLVKPGKKLRPGARILFGAGTDRSDGETEIGQKFRSFGRETDIPLKAEILETKEDGNRIVEFTYSGIWEEVLDSLGEMPLPPYIRHKLPREERDRYQTVYAKYSGSAAAPTAGLHFTKELLNKIREQGIKSAYVTLHVGLGTFRPVKADNILDHHMHTEYCRVTKEAADTINETKQNCGRIICVGTTSVRTLESMTDEKGVVSEGEKDTDIFIYPGYRFRAVDALITNFHLPESTLLMLVSAFADRERVLHAYKEAVKEKYRFFSFGDAMLII